MSEKVIRATVSADVRWIGTCRVEGPQCVQWHIPTFAHGEAVVVIPANVYDFLKQAEALVANGVVLDTDEYVRLTALDVRSGAVIDGPADYGMPPRKRCMNCDGNNVNAPCTCEEV